ncbi:NAD(P)-dependent oxidoreductase [Mycolicibacterium madagascariense]|uniref:NAD(P)-dependent oxidoreductase n=1 Tax=Mycolicibacterium madagascariense TaxID=212765 RepID=A0A7I7XAF4_9MYCO|nr:NmrA family NAD(P)-binding protein [Mycolicibacterium madagascariense]MCV7013394.1 NmrA family NAD(P)-binding protein [Mycolicibacterium madagascariense]BBZ25887.1 NAD(P)-dependent oxidoreductase [Mycolicibacterium madagascariense]
MIVITGANGQLATAVARHIQRLDPNQHVVGAARRPSAVPSDVFDDVRYADYDRPDSVVSALGGAHAVLLVSGTEFGRRVAQHGAVVAAAREGGASFLAYTSAPRVDSAQLAFGPEHLATEQLIRTSGLSYTLLRNNWYHENYVPTIIEAAATGAFTGNAANGRIASAAREDYAEATARILIDPRAHHDRTYELAGDTAWTYADLAELIADVLGSPVGYRDVSTAARRAELAAAGHTAAEITAAADIDRDIAAGALELIDHTLSRLLGRPTTPLRTTVEAAVASAIRARSHR